MLCREGLEVVKGPPIDPKSDEVFSLNQIADLIGTKPVTVRSWVKKGRISEDRRRIVQMRCIKMPRGKGSTIKAYHEFLELLNIEYEESTAPRRENGAEWENPYYIEGDFAVFRFSKDDLKWLGPMFNDDYYSILFERALGELK